MMGPEPEEANAESLRDAIAAALLSGSIPADRGQWAESYAKQSRSDLAIYELFTSKEMALSCPPIAQVEKCHSLHYLQMACEKIAKAYRFRYTNTPLENLLTSHVAFSKFVEGLMRAPYIRERYNSRRNILQHVGRIVRLLAREIETLAPALEREKSPQNTEYPWADSGQIIAPCEYSFPSVSLLETPEGRSFLEIIKTAINDFERIELP